jgi:hypothetical protein
VPSLRVPFGSFASAGQAAQTGAEVRHVAGVVGPADRRARLELIRRASSLTPSQVSATSQAPASSGRPPALSSDGQAPAPSHCSAGSQSPFGAHSVPDAN